MLLRALLGAFLLSACGGGSPATVSKGATAAGTASAGPSPSPAATTIRPDPTVSQGGLTLTFISPADGATVNGASGIDVHVRSSGPPIQRVDLHFAVEPPERGQDFRYPDGIAAEFNAPQPASPLDATFHWQPSDVGPIQLTVTAGTKTASASASIIVNVVGVVPTPAPIDDATARAKIKQAFLDKFGLSVPDPPVARVDHIPEENNLEHGWVSVVWTRSNVYRIFLSDSGVIEAPAKPLPVATTTTPGFCRPAGNYRALIVVVDYKNTDIGDQWRSALPQMVDAYNAEVARIAKAAGSKSPLLTLQATVIQLDPSQLTGSYVSPADVARSGQVDLHSFDVLMQLDLDAKGVQRVGANGYGGIGCVPGGLAAVASSGARYSPVFAVATSRADLTTDLRTLIEHEWAHTMGWEHIWGCSSYSTNLNTFGCEQEITASLFGWVDLDGDGVPEIVDPTPYGMPTSP